jgi:crossover junction endodeoxyribonuclease RuvC
VLGVDPGLNTTGYAVLRLADGRVELREAGVVRSRSRGTLEQRLGEIHEGVAEVISSLGPQIMALEELFSHYKRPRTAILMGHARGVICLAASAAGLPICHYGATQVKKMLTGSGRASKRQMQMAICRELALLQSPDPPDVADALAIALCHLYTHMRKVHLS